MRITIHHRHELGPDTLAAISELSIVVGAILRQGDKIMAALDDFIAAQQAFNTDVSGDLDMLVQMAKDANAKIADLTAQLANAGLTPAQTQALADLTTAGQALEAKADAAAGKTPPAPPAA